MEKLKIEVLRARMSGVLETLSRHAAHDKKSNISQGMADEFNSIREEFAGNCEEMAHSLPKGIESRTMVAQDFGVADATYLDLEIKVQQLLKLLDIAVGRTRHEG